MIYMLLLVNNCLAHARPAIPDTVVLQLKWKHQFQFAGYYAAIEQGYYEKAGLFVKILEAETGDESIPSVVKGTADFGIATSDLLLSRNNGLPIVILANIFQHSPHVFLTLKHDDMDNIHDIDEKSIMLEQHAEELLAYLKYEQISTEKLSFIPHTFNPEALINEDVFAMSAYSTDEPFLLEQAGIEYNIFNPRASGIDFYGDVLFTSESEIENYPERVVAFLDASLKGWEYAMENEEEIIDLILDKYSTRHSREHLQFESNQTKRLIMPDVVEIGYVNENRWQRIGEQYAEMDMLRANFSLDRFIYDRNPTPSNRMVYLVILSILVITFLTSFIAIRFYRLNQKLVIERKGSKEKEELLIILEERYRNLAEYAPFPILITSPDNGDILYMNQRASDKFEIDRKYAQSKHASVFYSNPNERDNLINIIDKQGFVNEGEVLLKTANGNTFLAHISSNIITFDNKPALFSAILDISVRLKLENDLKDANADKDRFFTIIAHDLRGPIGTLNSLVGALIDSKNIAPEQMDNILSVIKETSQNTFELLENLLMWAKAQKNEISYVPTTNNLFELIQSNLALFKPNIINKELEIINQCDMELQFIFDKEMISTVIRNLINNAIKYTNPSGQITINAFLQKGFLKFSIRDSGIGMDELKMKEIFDLASEKKSTPGTQGETGTGLGLILCVDFVKKHNGNLWVESKLGEGSSFQFSLPTV